MLYACRVCLHSDLIISLPALPLFANTTDEIGSRIRPRKSSRSPEPSRNRADSKTPGGDDDDAAAPEADAVLAIDRHKVRYTVTLSHGYSIMIVSMALHRACSCSA
jgi:hypothetical protein